MSVRFSLTATAFVVAAVLFTACGGDDGEATAEPTAEPGAATESPTADATGGSGDLEVVQSSDGSVTLEVPAGALPDGVAIEDLAVEIVALDELFDGDVPDNVSGAVRLEPSGTVFSEPVTLRTQIDGEQAPGLALLYSDDGTVEVLEHETVAEGDDGFVVTSLVEHFSDVIYVGVRNPIEFKFDPEIVNHAIGETFVVRARISRLDFEDEIRELNRRPAISGRVRLRPSDDPNWTFRGLIEGSGAAVATGPRVVLEEAITDGRSATFIEREFTCESEGPYQVNVGGSAVLGVRIIPIDPPGDEVLAVSRSSYGAFLETGARCTAAEATETPAPTSTAAPTATEASAISVGATSGVDHPPYARAYTNAGASVLLACLSGGTAAANAVVTVLFDGAGLSNLVLEAQLDGSGNAVVEVPIQNFGPFNWTVSGDANGVPLMGGDSGTVGPEENPGACGP